MSYILNLFLHVNSFLSIFSIKYKLGLMISFNVCSLSYLFIARIMEEVSSLHHVKKHIISCRPLSVMTLGSKGW